MQNESNLPSTNTQMLNHSITWRNVLNGHRSTKGHRSSQRLCVGAQLANNSIVSSGTIGTTLTFKLAQVMVSSHALFKPKITNVERTAHSIQTIIAFGEVLLLSMILFIETDCSNTVTNNYICKVLAFLGYMYNATLLIGWGHAEVSKEPHTAEGSAHTVEPVDGLSHMESGGSSSPGINKHEHYEEVPTESSDEKKEDGLYSPIII